MLKKIYEELVFIRKELQTIRKNVVPGNSNEIFSGDFTKEYKENREDELIVSTVQFGRKSLKWYIRMLCANVKEDPRKTLESWDD